MTVARASVGGYVQEELSVSIVSTDSSARSSKGRRARRKRGVLHTVNIAAHRFQYISFIGRHCALSRGTGKSFGSQDKYFRQFLRTSCWKHWLDRGDDYLMVQASVPELYKHLQRYDHADFPLHIDYSPWLRNAVIYMRRLLHPYQGTLTPPDQVDLTEMPYEASAAAGPRYRLQGACDKFEAYPLALRDASALAFDLFSRMDGTFPTPPCGEAAGRGKRVLEPSFLADPTKPWGRLVQAVDFAVILVAELASSQLNNLLGSTDANIALGKSYFYDGGYQYAAKFLSPTRSQRADEGRFLISIDFSRYDANFRRWMTHLVIEKVFRPLFQDGTDPKYDSYWNFIYWSMVHTDLAMPDGFVFRRHCGVASGHSFVTLVESVGTVFLLQSVYLHMRDEVEGDSGDLTTSVLCQEWLEDLTIDALGDDVQLSVPEHQASWFNLDRIRYHIDRMAKITVADSKSTQGMGLSGYHYLGFGLTPDYLPIRPTEESLLNQLVPERSPKTLEESVQAAMGRYLDNYHNVEVRTILGAFIDWAKLPGLRMKPLQGRSKHSSMARGLDRTPNFDLPCDPNADWTWLMFGTDPFRHQWNRAPRPHKP